jgi:UDP-N-acetylmuramoylalanine--D-glutamate ligase
MGLKKSGLAAIKLLLNYDYDITLTINNELSIAERNELSLYNVKIYEKGHPLSLLDEEWCYIVKNPGISYNIPFVKEALNRNIKIISEIELAYQLSNNIFLGITGTNGKTTVTTLIYEILKAQLDDVYCGGNIGIPISDIVREHGDNNIIVSELSSFQLMGIIDFKPKIATILNLAPDHLDYMNSVEEYYESKLSIYFNQDEHDYFVLNIDDALVQEYVKDIKAKIIRVSLNKKADAYLENDFIYFKDEAIININDIKIIGKHNLYNIIIAVVYAKVMGIDNDVIRKVISNFKGVEYRLEKVDGLNNNCYYNDSKATTPDSTITALEALSKTDLILIVGGYQKGLDNRPLINYLNKHANIKRLYTFGAIKDLFEDVAIETIKLEKLDMVIKDILENYHNQTILFSPATSSFDQYVNYEQRGEHFNKLVKGE